jgi:hypothetical protein
MGGGRGALWDGVGVTMGGGSLWTGKFRKSEKFRKFRKFREFRKIIG